ncbi:hypothetical protein FS842_008275 [Serendipita sp. 407]|nr:hypothetical protein FS842_008275 [Serendipita sp. 407]
MDLVYSQGDGRSGAIVKRVMHLVFIPILPFVCSTHPSSPCTCYRNTVYNLSSPYSSLLPVHPSTEIIFWLSVVRLIREMLAHHWTGWSSQFLSSIHVSWSLPRS